MGDNVDSSNSIWRIIYLIWAWEVNCGIRWSGTAISAVFLAPMYQISFIAANISSSNMYLAIRPWFLSQFLFCKLHASNPFTESPIEILALPTKITQVFTLAIAIILRFLAPCLPGMRSRSSKVNWMSWIIHRHIFEKITVVFEVHASRAVTGKLAEKG